MQQLSTQNQVAAFPAPEKAFVAVPSGSTVAIHFEEGHVMLLEGRASIFGAPMRLHVRYRFQTRGVPVASAGAAVAAAASGGEAATAISELGPCRLEIEGIFTYRTGITDSAGAELHAHLHGERLAAAAQNREGPRVLVVGNVDTGKSSLCTTLVNLAVGEGARFGGQAPFSVALVDLDIGQQSVALPGCIATAFIEDCVAIDDPFTNVMPLALFFGDKTVGTSTFGRYLDLCAHTKRCTEAVAKTRPDFLHGGLVVNTMGWIEDIGYDILVELIEILQITDVVVTGPNPDLRDKIVRSTATSVRRVNVFDYRSPGGGKGLYMRNSRTRQKFRAQQIMAYFNGTLRTPMLSSRVVVNIADLTFLNAVTFKSLPMPMPLSVCAVSSSVSADEAPLASVLGFVVILDVGRTTVSLLSPSPGPLPRRFLLVSPTIQMRPEEVPPI